MDNPFSGYTVQEPKQEEKTELALMYEAIPKVCFDLFETEKGRELRKLLSIVMLQQPVNHALNADYERACVYTEGGKAYIRQLFTWSDLFKAKIDAEAKAQQASTSN